MPVYFKKQAQIKAQSRAQFKALLFNKVFTEVSAEYSDYNNVFSIENIVKLLENTRINEYAIKLKEDKQLPFGPIYNLGPVELEILKTYIKTNLANSFIQSFKSLAGVFIFFNKKPDRNLRFYVDYWGFNNINIKNQYPLPLINKSLNWLGWAKRFIQLDLINAYHQIRICEDDK